MRLLPSLPPSPCSRSFALFFYPAVLGVHLSFGSSYSQSFVLFFCCFTDMGRTTPFFVHGVFFFSFLSLGNSIFVNTHRFLLACTFFFYFLGYYLAVTKAGVVVRLLDIGAGGVEERDGREDGRRRCRIWWLSFLSLLWRDLVEMAVFVWLVYIRSSFRIQSFRLSCFVRASLVPLPSNSFPRRV